MILPLHDHLPFFAYILFINIIVLNMIINFFFCSLHWLQVGQKIAFLSSHLLKPINPLFIFPVLPLSPATFPKYFFFKYGGALLLGARTPSCFQFRMRVPVQCKTKHLIKYCLNVFRSDCLGQVVWRLNSIWPLLLLLENVLFRKKMFLRKMFQNIDAMMK